MYSGRNSTAPGSSSKKRPNRDEDEDDLTKDMDDPSPETNITEVQLSKQCKLGQHNICRSLSFFFIIKTTLLGALKNINCHIYCRGIFYFVDVMVKNLKIESEKIHKNNNLSNCASINERLFKVS